MFNYHVINLMGLILLVELVYDIKVSGDDGGLSCPATQPPDLSPCTFDSFADPDMTCYYLTDDCCPAAGCAKAKCKCLLQVFVCFVDPIPCPAVCPKTKPPEGTTCDFGFGIDCFYGDPLVCVDGEGFEETLPAESVCYCSQDEFKCDDLCKKPTVTANPSPPPLATSPPPSTDSSTVPTVAMTSGPSGDLTVAPITASPVVAPAVEPTIAPVVDLTGAPSMDATAHPTPAPTIPSYPTDTIFTCPKDDPSRSHSKACDLQDSCDYGELCCRGENCVAEKTCVCQDGKFQCGFNSVPCQFVCPDADPSPSDVPCNHHPLYACEYGRCPGGTSNDPERTCSCDLLSNTYTCMDNSCKTPPPATPTPPPCVGTECSTPPTIITPPAIQPSPKTPSPISAIDKSSCPDTSSIGGVCEVAFVACPYDEVCCPSGNCVNTTTCTCTGGAFICATIDVFCPTESPDGTPGQPNNFPATVAPTALSGASMSPVTFAPVASGPSIPPVNSGTTGRDNEAPTETATTSPLYNAGLLPAPTSAAIRVPRGFEITLIAMVVVECSSWRR
jgi:hypothetical protein